MKYHPVTLGVKRLNWSPQADAIRVKGDVGDDARQAILKRDDHICQCCGFRAEKHQQILHLNGDTRDFRDENVVTACIFCHQCFDLELVGNMDSGMLIWLPEMTQANLHHLMRAVYVGRVTQGGLAETSARISETLMARGADAKKRLGSTDPAALALVMRDFLMQKQYESLQERLDGIRLLPLPKRMLPASEISPHITDAKAKDNAFPMILAYWRTKNGPFGAMPAQEWPRLFKDALDLPAAAV